MGYRRRHTPAHAAARRRPPHPTHRGVEPRRRQSHWWLDTGGWRTQGLLGLDTNLLFKGGVRFEGNVAAMAREARAGALGLEEGIKGGVSSCTCGVSMRIGSSAAVWLV